MGFEKLPQSLLTMIEKEGIIEESLITCILFCTFTNKLLEWMNTALFRLTLAYCTGPETLTQCKCF